MSLAPPIAIALIPIHFLQKKSPSVQLYLELKQLEILVQSNLAEYERLLKKEIDESLLIRWYIAKIDLHTALIEAVYDDSSTLKLAMEPRL
ncbi:hypothetical protein EON65_04320 [archaeon]|nr:MAG: hypothetical protein EON65_04320 [archaeon]